MDMRTSVLSEAAAARAARSNAAAWAGARRCDDRMSRPVRAVG